MFRIASSEARVESAIVAVNIAKDNLLTGVGFNAYRYAQINYGFRNLINSEKSHADAGADNSFLFVLATTGIFGLLIYLNFLKELFKKTYTTYKKESSYSMRKTFSIVTLSSLSGIIINAFFINSLFYPFILIWLFILMGITFSDND